MSSKYEDNLMCKTKTPTDLQLVGPLAQRLIERIVRAVNDAVTATDITDEQVLIALAWTAKRYETMMQ